MQHNNLKVLSTSTFQTPISIYKGEGLGMRVKKMSYYRKEIVSLNNANHSSDKISSDLQSDNAIILLYLYEN